MNSNENLIKVGITHGDINGIGYEVIIKSFAATYLQDLCIPVVYGDSKVASYHKKAVDIKDFTFNLIKNAEQAKEKRVNIVNIYDDEVKIELGISSEIAGKLAFLSLEQAVEDLKKHYIDVLVTAPINKNNIQSAQFKFPGHTEYLAQKFGKKDFLMLMVADNLRIGTATGHIPLKDVPASLDKNIILSKIQILNSSLIEDFGIRKPKIAVLGLNPHAGDCGLLGKEEQDIILPAINSAFENNILAFGPFPADGFFGSSEYKKYDGVIAMYHDQGLIPFKTLAFDAGVNYTAGLPYVRTSPAHGTAYDIAGKDIASPESFKEAVLLAIEIYKNRMEYKEINANPLKFSNLEDEN